MDGVTLPERGRFLRAVASLVAAVVLVPATAARAPAQGVPFVRTLAPPVEPCPVFTPSPVGDAARRDARRLRDEAAASALAGDAAGARDLLVRAAALDPTDADLAYRLARAHEDVNDARAARAAYCRFRALAPSPQDAVEAESRLAALEGTTPSPQMDSVAPAVARGATERFHAAVARASAGDFGNAERGFTAALELWPGHPALLLDRAAVHTVLGGTGAALADLDRYVAAVPAPLRSAVAARDVLREGRRDPTAVMMAGMLPGGSQVATGRPITGALVAAVAIAGVAISLESRTVQREQQFTDPFGNPYTDLVTVTEHPRRALGLSVGLTALLGGAIEGFLHARADRRDLERLRRDTRAAIQGDVVGAMPPDR